MTPFQQFRLWARRAPTGDRLCAGAAAVLVVAVVAWLLVPATSGQAGNQESLATVGSPAGATGGAASPPSSAAGAGGGNGTAGPAGGGGTASGGAPAGGGGTASGGAPAGGGGTASGGEPASTASPAEGTSPGERGCVSPPGSDQGVTASEIKIAVLLNDIAGQSGNQALGVPPPELQKANYEAVIQTLNADGGTACRKLVAQYFKANVADSSSLRQACLDIVESRPFAVLDTFTYYVYPSLASCYPENQIPFFGGAITAQLQNDLYPYMFGQLLFENTQRHTVFALAGRGFFNEQNGFKRLGFIYNDCIPSLVEGTTKWLREVGVQSSQIVTYNNGCSSTFGNPADLSQAVFKFQQAGVTHVTYAFFDADFGMFTRIAQQQNFHPKYGLPDNGLTVTSTRPATAGDRDNMADAVAITSYAFGEANTPGLTPSEATVRCKAIEKEHNLPDGNDSFQTMGTACNNVWFMAAAVNHAPTLRRDALAAGLQATGSLDLSVPLGPADFRSPGTTTGGQFWRVEQFHTSCSCWRVIEPEWKPGFT